MDHQERERLAAFAEKSRARAEALRARREIESSQHVTSNWLSHFDRAVTNLVTPMAPRTASNGAAPKADALD